jgi:SOS-response transcriptional repressor LexA
MSDNVQDTADQIYAFICAFKAKHGYPPSQEEIAQACYRSRPVIVRYLDRLEMQGKIRREPGKARGIQLIKEDEA